MLNIFSYKSMTGSSQYRFGVLAKIVKHMRNRHQDGDDHPLTIEDILDETNQLDIGTSVKTVRMSNIHQRIEFQFLFFLFSVVANRSTAKQSKN